MRVRVRFGVRVRVRVRVSTRIKCLMDKLGLLRFRLSPNRIRSRARATARDGGRVRNGYRCCYAYGCGTGAGRVQVGYR